MYYVIPYNSNLRDSFVDLNLEWLNEYFVVEPRDRDTFDQLEELIINNDGEVFFVKHDDKVVGTVAMQKISVRRYELAKMAVTRNYRGRGLSKLLIEACISFARRNGAEKIILVSNRSLTPALSLYKKYGFMEVPMEETEYSRANIRMELSLRQG